MNHNEALLLRANMRLIVLSVILEILDKHKDKPASIIHPDEVVEKSKIKKEHVLRCGGDLAKAFPIYTQFNSELSDFHWIVHKPTLKQIADALYIARTDGNCTSWNPE